MTDYAPKGWWPAQWAVAVTYLGLSWKRISADPYAGPTVPAQRTT
jgi:hypothetical protein